MPYSDQRAKDFFKDIEHLIHQLYTNPLPRKLFNRAQSVHRIIKSIQHKINNQNIIIRSTDKSKVFHLRSVQDYHRKALQYMNKINVYTENLYDINTCHEHIENVLTIIDPMLKKKNINLDLWRSYMIPNE
ncbi:unnamed protein product [Rotaria sp. Silwood2]|nr:unnamed protein product [Rotaria sp. Silwood2]CAF2840085.1 unnamed protein product [Rotaria sp. Silwood2]CAF4181447.1 unnamed protein product [Rotaria sp. Silwood2]